MTIRERTSKPAVMYRCNHCKSTAVKRPATLVWDVKAQAWKVYRMASIATCDLCDDETALEEVKIL